ncbi:hypothetical protein niasHT_031400 [Heterodera trifolii]|uniref:Uncharacterized protein n=1 Tax=Heterodera trifolii TaxID=157864 RepID=A0ABD2J697_9BILA
MHPFEVAAPARTRAYWRGVRTSLKSPPNEPKPMGVAAQRTQTYWTTLKLPLRAETYWTTLKLPPRTETYWTTLKLPPRTETYWTTLKLPPRTETYWTTLKLPPT